MEPRLPPELIDCIVNHLFNDIPALASIRFTNRTFNISCRRYIFRTVNLDTSRRYALQPCIEKFEQLLASSPSIVPFVKELSLDLVNHMFIYPSPELNNALSHLLRQFTQIAVFDFGSEPVARWKDWPSAIRSAIKVPLSSSCLTSVGLFNLQGVPASFFDACPTLERLTLVAVTFEDDRPNAMQSRPFLQSLHLVSSDPDPLPRGIPVDLTHLRQLTIVYRSSGFPDGTWVWKEYLEPVSKTLEKLDISQLDVDIANRDDFDFGRLIALRALTMSHNERAQHERLSLQACLRAAPAPPPSLRVLELKMDHWPQSDIPLLERLKLWDDAIGKSSWNLLQRVILHETRIESREYAETLRRSSPRLSEKGILSIKY